MITPKDIAESDLIMMKEEKEKFDKEKKMLLEENIKLKNLLKKYENP